VSGSRVGKEFSPALAALICVSATRLRCSSYSSPMSAWGQRRLSSPSSWYGRSALSSGNAVCARTVTRGATNGPRAVACDSLGHMILRCHAPSLNETMGSVRTRRTDTETAGLPTQLMALLCMRSRPSATSIWSPGRRLRRTCCRSPMAKETRDQRGLRRQQYRRRDAPRCAVQRRHPTPSLRRRSHRVLAIALAHSMGRGGRIGTQFGHRRLAPRSALLTGVSPRSWITLERRLAVEVGGSAIERYRES
jgi:hypothetical protein